MCKKFLWKLTVAVPVLLLLGVASDLGMARNHGHHHSRGAFMGESALPTECETYFKAHHCEDYNSLTPGGCNTSGTYRCHTKTGSWCLKGCK